MSWEPLLFLLILGLPLLGALVALLARRRLPPRAGVLIAALCFFLSAAGIIVLVQWFPLLGGDLGTTLPLPQEALRQVPTAPWVQPPRTLTLPPTIAPTMTPTVPPSPTPTVPPLSRATVTVRNGTHKAGLAGRTAERLSAQGFNVIAIEDDSLPGERPHTLILDRGDHPEIRQALAEFLKVSSDYVTTHSDEMSQADIVVVLGDDFEE